MKPLLSLLAVSFFLSAAPASADEFAHVDPEKLKRGIEKLAEAWSIPEAVFIGATDDFADEPPFAHLAEELAAADLDWPRTRAYSELEESLRGLFSEEDMALILGEIGRLRRLN